jgi:hypothetical protein
MALASEAILQGWTRQQVIAALISRIRRDEGYLAYRLATGRRTTYDDQVKADMRALALAACRLEDESQQERPRGGFNSGSSTLDGCESIRERG